MDQQKISTSEDTTGILKRVRRQAVAGDPVCAEYLSQTALNNRAGGGYSWIETQLDMEDQDDDERPY